MPRREPDAPTPRPEPDAAPAALTRNALREIVVARTVNILAAEGLAAIQIRRIADVSGCSVGTLYNLFGDRDGLILAANRATLSAMGAPLMAAQRAAARDDLEGRLLALAHAYQRFALANLQRWLAVFEFRLPEGRNLPGDYVAERSRLLGLIEDAIADALPTGPARTDAARALFGAVHGIVILAISNRLSQFDAGAVDREIGFIVGAAARGMVRQS